LILNREKVEDHIRIVHTTSDTMDIGESEILTDNDVIIGDSVDADKLDGQIDDVSLVNFSLNNQPVSSRAEEECEEDSRLKQLLAEPRIDQEEGHMSDSSLFKTELDLGLSEIDAEVEAIPKYETDCHDGENVDTSIETSWIVITQEPEPSWEHNVLESLSDEEQIMPKTETKTDECILGFTSNCNNKQSALDEISAEIEMLSQRNQTINSQTLQTFICAFCLTHLDTAAELNNHVLVFHSSYR
jgi:hypothetical protein